MKYKVICVDHEIDVRIRQIGIREIAMRCGISPSYLWGLVKGTHVASNEIHKKLAALTESLTSMNT